MPSSNPARPPSSVSRTGFGDEGEQAGSRGRRLALPVWIEASTPRSSARRSSDLIRRASDLRSRGAAWRRAETSFDSSRLRSRLVPACSCGRRSGGTRRTPRRKCSQRAQLFLDCRQWPRPRSGRTRHGSSHRCSIRRPLRRYRRCATSRRSVRRETMSRPASSRFVAACRSGVRAGEFDSSRAPDRRSTARAESRRWPCTSRPEGASTRRLRQPRARRTREPSPAACAARAAALASPSRPPPAGRSTPQLGSCLADERRKGRLPPLGSCHPFPWQSGQRSISAPSAQPPAFNAPGLAASLRRQTAHVRPRASNTRFRRLQPASPRDRCARGFVRERLRRLRAARRLRRAAT